MNKKKILVIDDDESILEVLSKALTSTGYIVETANNEQDFTNSLKQSKPDAILMDINLPWMDGIRLCRDIKVAPDTSDIPIIIVTAHSDKSTLNEAILFGASDFIAKPFEMSEINSKLKECINKAEAKKRGEK